jgi:hypothetical protein
MEDVRTLRWTKTCSRCGQEMPPGTELVLDEENRGPRGGKMFMHLECRPKSNPSAYYRMLAARNRRPAAQAPARRRNPSYVEHDLYEARALYEAMHGGGRRGGRR